MSADDAFRTAVTHHREGRLAEAEAWYQQTLAAAPAHFDALNLLGAIHAQRGDAASACALFDRALGVKPDSPIALSNRSIALRALGRTEEALTSAERAIELKPDYVIALNNRGLALQDLQRPEEALASFDNALALNPDYPEARANRTRAIEALLGKFDAMLAREPNYPEALFNRGLVLQDLMRFSEALASFERAIAAKPDYAEAHFNRGLALQALERHDEALASYDAAIELKPGDAAMRFGAAQCALLLGQFARGFADYEYRPRRDARKFSQPLWLDNASVAGKTVLLHAEQGVGDTLQMARYAKLLAAQGANVVLEVQPPLKPLLATFDPRCAVVATGEPLPAFDLHCPMMSLPLAFKTEIGAIPGQSPYLTADPALVQQWQAQLGPKRGLRVGLAWSGRADHANDRNRSIPLAAFASLLSLPIQFISLQKDVRPGDGRALSESSNLRHMADGMRDFADTAAMIACCDVVISVDTAAAHLAGALGKPVWVLLPWAPDWRWLVKRDDSPWYPSAKLFRQPKAGDWAPVIAALAETLRKQIS